MTTCQRQSGSLVCAPHQHGESVLRKKIVAGNWKLNGNNDLVKTMLLALDDQSDLSCQVVICPPMTLIVSAVGKASGSKVAVGSQNVAAQAEGAFTGEVSASMIAETGAKYVIVGHSERRTLFGDTDELVAQKVQQVVKANLIPILCVGESEQENEQQLTEQVIETQLNAVFRSMPVADLQQLVVAYEPVWAIGTGKTATPEQAQYVHRFIRELVAKFDAELAAKMPILYGGSVKPDNAQQLFSQADIDGGLIGGASLQADSFIAICQSA